MLARSSQESQRTRDTGFRELAHEFCETFEVYVYNIVTIIETGR